MKFAVIGMARSGLSALNLLLKSGVDRSDIATFDTKPGLADWQDGPALIKAFKPQKLIVSPGVPLTTPWIQEALQAGAVLSSEIGLACEFLADEKIIGITGSVGKSTTVALLFEAAKKEDPDAFLGGNFGVPFCEYILQVLDGKRRRARWLILELSSFQLENCDPLQLDWSAITSLTSNHLERYSSRDEYYQTKWSLLSRTKRLMFLNARGGDLMEWAKARVGNWVAVAKEDALLAPYSLQSADLIGDHNQDNLALAASLAAATGWSKESIDAMKSFQGLSHRLENLGVHHGVFFINDSKATALDSVETAVASCLPLLKENSRLFVYLGGRDKNLPWIRLKSLSNNPKLHVVLFGEAGPQIKSQTGWNVSPHLKLKMALENTQNSWRSGDIVLLSPGGTGLDEFKNFEERGDFFRSFVRSYSER